MPCHRALRPHQAYLAGLDRFAQVRRGIGEPGRLGAGQALRRQPDVARAFLVSEPTMAARITRAKKKIAEARIPYRVPSRVELPERVDSVLTAVHLLFSTGHTAGEGDALVREELCDRALHLARTLAALLPEQAETRGLLGLLLLTDARRATRTSAATTIAMTAGASPAKTAPTRRVSPYAT